MTSEEVSGMAGTEEDVVRALAQPLVAERGLDLVEVQIKGAGGTRLVRVLVDRKGGVELADCQEISRKLSDALDADDPIDGRYSLEVSSPGVDRPLTDRGAFDRAEGRLVLVQREAADGSSQEIRGTVTAAEEDAVVLAVDGAAVRIPYTDIRRATQTLPW
jgi:ribosome maturation factor RimP